MTRLKELRLHGFKTFADPTRFVFERGVTAVIGPNGSGKSNMADAVRWVLGEQSNRSLRTRRADDVIFAGSQDRRPQGMAEAILTLDNSDGWLPIDFTEVSIGRRAYRSGETEYLVNGSRARLKEVVELLAGGRLGANELVVVGQGTVDAALSLRPEERRQLFEEAAGVKNLQVRKNEALARLGRARDNLTRVGDLIGELKPQVRRLAQQAQHQQEHDAVGRRARALVIELHRRRELTARASLGEARRRLAAAETELGALRAAEEAGREAITQAESDYWAAEAAARRSAEGREASREALIRAEAAASAAVRRHDELLAGIARAEAEIAEADEALATDPAATRADVEAAWSDAQEAERAWRAAVASLEGMDRELAAADHALSAARAAAGVRMAEAARHDEASARAKVRVERIEGELEGASVAATEALAAVAPVAAELAAADAAEAAARARLEAARDGVATAAAAADHARARSTALAERVGGLQAELEMLNERVEGGARLGPLLAAAGWRALVDAVAPPAEAWAAIETLVGGELQDALLWRDDAIIEHASAARGMVHLLAGSDDRTAEDDDARAAALAAVGGTRTVAEWIGIDHGPRLFMRTVVAPDLARLLAGWRQLPAGWCAVTPEGDLADERGLAVIRGRDERTAGEAARQGARRRELAELLESLESEQIGAAAGAAEALAASSAARREQEAADEQHADAARRAIAARTAHSQRTDALARSRTLQQALEAELHEARGAASSASLSPTAPDEDLEQLAGVAADFQHRHEQLAAEREARRAAWQEARARADAADAQRGGGPFELAVLQARREHLKVAVTADRGSLTTLAQERAAADEALAAAAAEDARAATERMTADEERDRRRAALLDQERERGGGASRLADLERRAQSGAIETQRLEDELAAIGRERDLAIESLPPAEAPDPGEAAADPSLADMADASMETITAELTRVRRTLAQIGSVNPFAIEEHRELAARLGGLAGQDADLSAAIESTEELIARLHTEIAGQFNAAFVAIGAKFDEFCRLLFAGGSASLQMSDATDGDAAGGIEIAVQPPGKRLQRLAMLSGGERALAGVALLFAMLSVNPVPFCILDEVDAALDEANIGRFADALRQLSQQIDFVVITHNRATIETADTIYGVTMTDAAVSRLLSLRLADLPAEVAVG